MKKWTLVNCMESDFQKKIKKFPLGKVFDFKSEFANPKTFTGVLQQPTGLGSIEGIRNFDLGARSIMGACYVDLNS